MSRCTRPLVVALTMSLLVAARHNSGMYLSGCRSHDSSYSPTRSISTRTLSATSRILSRLHLARMLSKLLILCFAFSGCFSSASARITLTPPPNNASTSSRPQSLNAIWSQGPGTDWFTGAYPIGNGYLGEMVLGRPAEDVHFINIASLWTGGPFRNSTYSAGNGPASANASYAAALANTRADIAAHGTGSINAMMGNSNDPDYGSYSTAGAINISSPSLDADITSYTRVLDFDQGLVNISWTESGVSYNRVSFCSNPGKICATYTSANASSLDLTYSLSTPVGTVPDATCSTSSGDATLVQRGRLNDTTDGIAQPMLYEVRVLVNALGGNVTCEKNGTASVAGTNASWIIWSGETEFKLENCARAAGFSCKGPDPTVAVESNIQNANSVPFSTLLASHISDYSALSNAFQLDIGQSSNKADIALPTDQLVDKYSYSDSGSPLLEHNVYSYGRHMQISSARAGYLPPNLQGLWLQTAAGAWGADFHYDINLQMMQWAGESTGISDGIVNTGNWMLYAMADRGTDTAKILYDADGFVFHTASNLFGYTGLQGDADGVYHPEWSDFTVGPAWLLQHLYDHFVYDPAGGTSYLRTVTYPLMKRHAQFQMSFLVNDTYFNDGTLVVSPCNSPEQVYTTLGCTYNQQQTFELLHNIRKLYAASGDDDDDFLDAVNAILAKLYDGIRVGNWGQLQEWKIDKDNKTDEHRHLSHLLGVYPGWEISGYIGQSLGNQSVLDAAQVSLQARGNGTTDSDAGWEKVMRSVVASSLGNASHAMFEYRYMIYGNLNGNLLSMYSGHNSPFQMDANGGAPAAVINMLFQSLDSTKEYRNVTQVKLLPALPPTWPTGLLSGGRLRDGLGIDMSWSGSLLREVTIKSDRAVEARTVALQSASFGDMHAANGSRVLQEGDTISFALTPGESITLTG